VVDAVQEVVRRRDSGLGWVLRTDIADGFPTLPRDTAVRLLLAALPDDSLNRMVEALTHRRTTTRHGRRDVAGLAQGVSLSPLLCNLVLKTLDDALLDQGFPVVRFADDLAVPCASSDDARTALRVATRAVREQGMNLNQEKTEITSFDQGFCFLGEDFGPTYPPVVPEHRVEEPTARVLYVGLPGSRVRVQAGRIVVTTKNEVDALSVPSSHVGRVVLFGPVGLSAGARSWLLSQGVDAVFLSRRGGYLGHTVAGPGRTRIVRLRAQLVTADDPERTLHFGRAAIRSKIRHQITLLQRFLDPTTAEDVRPDLALMRTMMNLVPDAAATDELMGIEGAAAKSYFHAWTHLLPEDVTFTGRNRRPPMDVVNAALGYGYAILLGECVSALMACGLEPAAGLLHADDDYRPSLALDLMEEFRPYVVDQVVVHLCRRKTLTAQHGRERKGESGVWLTKEGKTVLVDAYEKRMQQFTGGAIVGFSGTIRRHIYRQAQRLAAFVHDPDVEWMGLSWR
jgi:CRISPR-associated protein Cas1